MPTALRSGSQCDVLPGARAERAPSDTRSYGVVTCMETLEHCTDPQRSTAFWRTSIVCARAMEQSSSAYPIETGPVFVLKYLARKLAVWRGLSSTHATRRHPWRDTVRMLFATERTVLSSAGLRRSAVALPLTLRLQLATAPHACRRSIRDRADALHADGTVARMVQQSGLVRLPAAIAATRV